MALSQVNWYILVDVLTLALQHGATTAAFVADFISMWECAPVEHPVQEPVVTVPSWNDELVRL